MASKAAYQQKLEAQIKEWDARMAQLRARAHLAAADVRIRYENELEELARQRKSMQHMLEDMSRHGEHAWQDVKEGVEKARVEMSRALDRFSDYFRR